MFLLNHDTNGTVIVFQNEFSLKKIRVYKERKNNLDMTVIHGLISVLRGLVRQQFVKPLCHHVFSLPHVFLIFYLLSFLAF